MFVETCFCGTQRRLPTPLPWYNRSAELVGSLRGHTGVITGILLDDTVTTLVTASSGMTRINAALSVVSLTLSADGAIIVHDLKTGNVPHQYGGRNVSVEGIALSGNLLISVTADRVRISFAALVAYRLHRSCEHGIHVPKEMTQCQHTHLSTM